MIPNYRTILYATDLSASAADALRHSVALARHFGSSIHVLHAMPEVEPAVLNFVSTVMGEDKLADMELAHKEEISDQIRKRILAFAKEELIDHPEDLERITEIEVHHGNPVERILEAGDRIDADLIVLGSHGKGRIKYTFLGSVAEKVLRKSTRPVIVVPCSH